MNDDLIDMNDYLILSSILCDVPYRPYSFVAIIFIFLLAQLHFLRNATSLRVRKSRLQSQLLLSFHFSIKVL